MVCYIFLPSRVIPSLRVIPAQAGIQVPRAFDEEK